MKKIYFKSLIVLIVFALFISAVPVTFVTAEESTIDSVNTDKMIEQEYKNTSIVTNIYDSDNEVQDLQIEVSTDVEAEAEISLNYSTNQGFLSGIFVDENGIEQKENYEIEIVGEDWVLLNTTNNETFTISDTEISASAWWVPVLILVAKIGKVAAKAKKLNVDDALKKIPKNTVKMSDKELKKIVGDVHDFKGDYVPNGTPVSHFNVYKDKDTGRLWLFENKGAKRKIPTYEVVKK